MGPYRNLALGLLLTLLVLAAGCSKKDKQDQQPGPSVEQVQKQAQEMDVEQLKTNAIKCRDEILAGKAKVEQLVLKLQDLTQEEKSAGVAQQINAELGELQKSMLAARNQLKIYYTKLVEKGADVSDLGL
jgi:hypothetical protein